MRKFKWITGVSILLFLVASALPAYSASNPWPNGTKGPNIDAGFVALENNFECVGEEAPGTAQAKFDNVEASIEHLDYTLNGNTVGDYPLPLMEVYAPSFHTTMYKDKAAMAWTTYHALWDYDQGKDVSGKVWNVLQKFLNKTAVLDGTRISGRIMDNDLNPPTLNHVEGYLFDLFFCVGGELPVE